MTDLISPERRSQNMRRIKSKDTVPEMRVRRLAHRLGYRYRLHRTDLPGKPDLVFSARRKAIFIHGCFWHGHEDAYCIDGQRKPKSNLGYWIPKLRQNAERDAANSAKLSLLGWTTLIIWDCETGVEVELAARLTRFLDEEPVNSGAGM